MTDRERLKVIDKRSFDDCGDMAVQYEDYDWLIDQAERVQVLERSNRQIKRNIGIYQSINEDAVEKNKRYRDSIKKAISYFNYDEHQRGMAELQKALGEY